MALALLYGGIPTPLLTKLGPSLIFPKEARKLEQNFLGNKYCSKVESSHGLARANSFKERIGGRVRAGCDSEELERINQNVRSHLEKLADGKSLEGGEDLRSNWRAVEHCSALLHWLHLHLDLKELRQNIPLTEFR